MTRQMLMLLAAAGSFLLLAGAFFYQSQGYAPCAMCLWQRWPHAVAVALGAVALIMPLPVIAVLGGLAAATTGGIGVYHTGVERGWWAGPDSCTGGDSLAGLSGDSLLSLDDATVVMCDQVSWEMFGLSMASWNALISFGLAAIWIMAALRADRSAA